MTATAETVIKRQEEPGGRRLLYLIGEILLWALLIGVALIEIAPISWMVSTSLRDPKNSFDLPPDFLPTAFHWQNYMVVINSPDIEFLRFFWNSLKIALLVTGAQLITCSMAGLRLWQAALSGTRFSLWPLSGFTHGSRHGDTHSLVHSDSRTQLDGYPLGAHLAGDYQRVLGSSYYVKHFMALPQELIDAAKIDGAGYFRVYWQILLPLTGPALSALGIFTFLGAWNNFVGPLLFLRSWENYTFPIAIATLRGYMGTGNQSEVLAGIMISIFPILVVFLIAQRWIVQGAAITGMKG